MGPHCSMCGTPEPVSELKSFPGTEVISVPTPKKGCAMDLSTLTDARDEIDQALQDANDKLEELQNAVYELENARDSLNDIIDTIENFGGVNVSVEIESLSVDIDVSF